MSNNAAQIEQWNGRVGEKWAELHVELSAMLAAATIRLVERAGVVDGLQLLDIGCGNGDTCALWLQGGAVVTGLDVSGPMLSVARQRLGEGAHLICADAGGWRGATPYDLAVSQFGLMFFDDPAAAFTNIASNLRPAGRLVFTCWRSESENQWVSAPLLAVRDLLPDSAPADPLAPGPFALRSSERIAELLGAAGFSGIQVEPFDFPVCLAQEGGVPAALRFILQIGPTGAALAGAERACRDSAKERLTSLLAKHEQHGRVTLGGAAWLVQAHLPAR